MAIIIETCPICGHDLVDLVICTYPPIPKKSCPNCGWSWEGKREEVIRVPFGGNNPDIIKQPSLNDYINIPYGFNTAPSPCDSCPNNVKNGGSGVCNCILGLPNVTC